MSLRCNHSMTLSWLLFASLLLYAFCARGVLAVSRRRIAKLERELAATRYDLAFAAEKNAASIRRDRERMAN